MHPLDFSTLLRLRDRDYVDVSVTDAHVVALLTKTGTRALRMVSRTGRDHPSPCMSPVTVTTTKMPAAPGSERGAGAKKANGAPFVAMHEPTCWGIDGGRTTTSAMQA
jgi:hypothetical protein